MGRIPTLDGWRGIAISLVLIAHLQYPLFGHSVRWWPPAGIHGVTMFFVLSGFLITTLLLKKPGTLRAFYIRRFFRLMPAAWTYLAAMVLFSLVSEVPFISRRAVLSSLLFYRNFAILPSPTDLATQHFWSLSIEEQFYLVWPPLLFMIGARRGRWVALTAALAVAAWRMVAWKYYCLDTRLNHTEVQADALLMGCTLAILLQSPETHEMVKRLALRVALPALIVSVICTIWLPSSALFAESVALATLMGASTSFPGSPWFHWLEWKPLAGLGRISYSVYLWQQFPMMFHGRVTPILLCSLPYLAGVSYLLIERPSIRLGAWLQLSRVYRAGQPTAPVV
jgi:peptidoglycan/LPS O-acetylase OafA/YrhL